MSALHELLSQFRSLSQTEREKGTYFEKLIRDYLTNEASYKDLYEQIWMFADWAKENGQNAQDAGIDLVAKTFTGELHAVQCKLYAEDYRLQKSDIDSFFTASGKKPFTHRLIVATTDKWSHHAEEALVDQQPPVTRITLTDLEQSQIDWEKYKSVQKVALKPKKSLRPHQKNALDAVKLGLREADRGKLIMACGTGKTFTSLKIAEELAGQGKQVLFLVPSLSLLSQTLTEWTQESVVPLHSFAVCSDSAVGKKTTGDEEDRVQLLTHELRYPATTDAKALAREMAARHDASHMSVVFATYHSIEVLHQAQAQHGLADFDLIICDEAHRTTGAIFEGVEESNFVRIHEATYVRGAKRLYMTATPRIFADSAKAKAEQGSVALCSMDDVALYGHELFVLTFSEAVKQALLVDYKVVVLAVEEAHINRKLQQLLADANNDLKVDDAARIVGCWKALAKQGLTNDLIGDENAMRRAVAFCQVIEPAKKAKVHKVSSKTIAGMFQEVVEAYQAEESIEPAAQLRCEAQHVDGSMNATEKDTKLAWLKEESPEQTCRILSNVRCLSEGVDVPALDAVLFLTPRSSQVDVVQSVGRVMRNAPGKKRGYVILPVVIPAGKEPHEALDDNQTYKVVWQVLQALRSHDDRFDAIINKMDLDLNRAMLSRMEVIAITDKVPAKPHKAGGSERDPSAPRRPAAKGSFGIGATTLEGREEPYQEELQFEIGEIERAIYAKIVAKCGNRHHWEDWATDIAKIARTHIDRIQAILEDPAHETERRKFKEFADELRDDLNDSITDGEIVEMLAQHLITKPVFDALFADYSFASHNPISVAMQGVLDALEEHSLSKEADTLERFYASVKQRADGIENATGKQKIVVELYDKFFRNAFPKMTERLGIVYTPVEVVDFIIHSVDHLLQKEFGQRLGSKGVHIIDPFTGTGTFVTRLLQSGLIKPEELPFKYKNEIHANELVLLAYYIAAINIEAVYHSIVGGKYEPFEGICLTDTFQLYEKEDLISAMLVDNSTRRKRQKALDIRVILGNPPYSAGQANSNDNNANVVYPSLDERIRTTYAERSTATLKNALYDSYIRAIRWASDRVGKSGIVGFVTNAGFVEANTADGLRKCLVEEFSSVHVFHLRGNQRTQGETSRREGGKIFGSGSRAPIAISFLVKNPAASEQGKVFVHDIGDYLTREEKLQKIVDFGSVAGITAAEGWQAITPDEHGDWLKQRDNSFAAFIEMGNKKGGDISLFGNYSRGVVTGRDAWCFNSSRAMVQLNMASMVKFYNSEVDRYILENSNLGSQENERGVDAFINLDAAKISWTRSLKQELAKHRHQEYSISAISRSLYRPYTKQWMYFDRRLNEMVLQMPKIFPDMGVDNIAIMIKGNWRGEGQFALVTNCVSSDQPDGGAQCFPLYLYDEPESGKSDDLFASAPKERTRRDAITKEGLTHFQAAYPGESIVREDIFYYVYGLLHSPDYRERYADNLSKELPRIPCVKTAADFWAFSKAGRALAALHLNYETVEPYPCEVVAKGALTAQSYRVEKMKYKSRDDKSELIYNDHIRLKGIPLEAYEYVVNGKPALDWVVERQCVKIDKDSGIVNDANDWATETMNNPKYPLELFQRVITVSLETMKIVNVLPGLHVNN
jgi:predicted helicase